MANEHSTYCKLIKRACRYCEWHSTALRHICLYNGAYIPIDECKNCQAIIDKAEEIKARRAAKHNVNNVNV